MELQFTQNFLFTRLFSGKTFETFVKVLNFDKGGKQFNST